MSPGSDSLFLFYQYRPSTDFNYTIYRSLSTDGGLEWSESEEILATGTEQIRPQFIISDNGFWLVYQSLEPTPFQDITQSDIVYSFSDDKARTWSEPATFSRYKGYDGDHSACLIDGKPYIIFVSHRTAKIYQDSAQSAFWYGIAGISEDNYTPPFIYDHHFSYRNNFPLINMNISARADDDAGISSINFNFTDKKGKPDRLQLYDDGTHDDEVPGDNVYTNALYDLTYQYDLDYFFDITEIDSLTAESVILNVISPFTNTPDVFAFDNNNLWLPLNNSGIMADISATASTGEILAGGRYDGIPVIFSSGFGMSGYSDGTLWANGVMTSSRLEDYIPGRVNPHPSDPADNIYVLRSSHVPFTYSWLEWKDAVELGAKFYDGNGDGIYNPVDLNGNGEWDVNEDRPDLLGDITAWCVYNDGVTASARSFRNVQPRGIEIRQTIFSYDKESYPELSDVIFMRYNIENTGTVSDILDSVYFCAWMDGDLGQFTDDMIGTDTLLNSTYTYNDGRDNEFGNNPPAMFITLLQGPAVYIPDETFSDVNGNGVFDSSADIPYDTAKIYLGPHIGSDSMPGAKNLPVSSAVQYIESHPTQGDPDNENQLRNYMLGYNMPGNSIDPCNWEFGEVLNGDCSTVNPKFMYSGDPVDKNGWICKYSTDQRQMITTGPFLLETGEPVELIFAYVAGRGTDAINSISVARETVKDVIRFYETNFSDYTVGIRNNKEEQLPTEFRLEQNYPNPFNPVTTIEYRIPQEVRSKKQEVKSEGLIVKMIIYDVLGREVATLVNKPQTPGNYRIQFDAGHLASGVYFYQLKYGSLIQSKKMILLQ